jgi:hypothetical protein
MDLSKGSEPREKNGRRYCCDGCAEGTGCICEERQTATAKSSPPLR